MKTNGMTKTKAREYLKKIYEKNLINIEKLGTNYMNYTENGVYLKSDKYNWTCGFYAGMLWLLSEEFGDKHFYDVAEETEKKLDAKLNAFTSLTHDVGFMWLLTSGEQYRLYNSEESKLRLMKAAAVLASRYNPKGRFIKAWNKVQGQAIIDCMMNIPLLYEMAEWTNEPSYRNIAVDYADMAASKIVREDGSISHIAEFNPISGEFIGNRKGAGYSDTSAWSRGCAWAIYGFAISYYYTKDERYYEISKRCADHFVKNLNEDGMCPYDFRAPDREITDSSAAAIAACGMLLLSQLSKNDDEYYQHACDLIECISEKYTDFSLETENILTGATVERDVKGVMTGIIYADYYYTEALYRICHSEFLLPWKNGVE